LRHRTPTLV